ncbi:MAG: hypothetical protein H6908_03205 [Hyphomicrobiales bacterium]|nr:hypothetical protein [Hyphomicrobiales bacterium]
MMKKHASTMHSMDMKAMGKNCHCPKTKNQPAPCCKDTGCNMQCSAMLGGMFMLASTAMSTMIMFPPQAIHFSQTDTSFSSLTRNTQDRPPKRLL